MFKKNFILLILFSLLLLFPLQSWSQLKLLPANQKRYAIENTSINESSGLACSTRDKHLLWTHNDSGHMPIIYALDNKGRDLATFHLDAIQSYDWEDMDAFEYQGKHYLLIADTGDNRRIRWEYRINIIPEPNLKTKATTTISPAWSIVYEYDDGQSYDVEAVAVDRQRQKIVLLTKRTAHAYMFELPLKPDNKDELQIAVKTGEFKDIVHPSALDISADGKLMSINTYRRIHRFRRTSAKKKWQYQNSLKYKKLFQPEALCLRKDEKYYYVTSERKSYLLRVRGK